MQKRIVNEVPLWKFDILEKEDNLLHFVSGKDGGTSKGEFESLNLGFNSGDNLETVVTNRTMLAQALDISYSQLFFVSQYHSDQILVVDAPFDGNPQKADALITNKKDICICVMGADCVPLLAYDPAQKVIAAIHSGWRGTAATITAKTLKKMQELYNCKPENIILTVGPSISQSNFEVGADVVETFTKSQGEGAKDLFLYDQEKNKYFPDLWTANKNQALDAGLKPENIEIAGICTYTHHDEFFSARYYHNKTGRFAAGIMLK